MERHKCKLCSRTFSNGRALGGHMKAHLATLPLPPKPQPFHHHPSSSDSAASLSYESESSPSSSEDEDEEQEKALIYGLRENPKKSFRFADPEFNDGFVVVQDRESETESKNPTRQRSKRTRRSSLVGQNQSLEPKKPKLSFMESPPLSSVSDFSPEEDVAMCLMMLSRDMGKRNNVIENGDQEKEEKKQKKIEIKLKKKRVRGKHHHHHHQCENCGKNFRSSRALGSHRSVCCRDETGGSSSHKIFECPFCFKVFGSGQALGGHKRSHLMQSSSSSNANNNKVKESFIDLDLNLPAPIEEEDDLSIVSDVSDV